MFKKVKDDASFVRDTKTNAILNVDNSALLAYKKRKKANNDLKNDVDQIKKDIMGIKQMLVKLLDK